MGEVKNRIHYPDSNIHKPRVIRHNLNIAVIKSETFVTVAKNSRQMAKTPPTLCFWPPILLCYSSDSLIKYGKIKLSYSKLSDNSKSFYKDQVY